MNKSVGFGVILSVLFFASGWAEEAAVVPNENTLQDLTSPAETKTDAATSSSSEEFDLDTLKPEELKELREWAASVNLTWTQIEALNGFYKEQKEDKANGTKKVNIQKLCKSFATESSEVKDEQDESAKKLAVLGHTIRLLTLFQQIETAKETEDGREIFLILKEVCYLVNVLGEAETQPDLSS